MPCDVINAHVYARAAVWPVGGTPCAVILCMLMYLDEGDNRHCQMSALC